MIQTFILESGIILKLQSFRRCGGFAISLLMVAVCLVLGPKQDLLAQKDFLLSLPEENKFAFNPAYAGMEGSLDVTVWGREQWNGIPGRPRTQSLLIHLPAYRIRGGLGLRLINDQLGPFDFVKAEVGYDYVVASDDLILSLGLTAGINQIGFNGNELRANDGLYTGQIVQHNDPLLPENNVSTIVPTSSFGFYIISNIWEGGLALENIHFGQGNFETDEQQFDWAPQPTANLYFDYGIELNVDWYLYPCVYVKSDFTHLQTLLKLNASYDDIFSAGLGVRGYNGNSLESMIISAGYVIDDHFTIYYAYDLGLSGLATEASGSHEFILRYNLNKAIGKGQAPKIIGNPRYF